MHNKIIAIKYGMHKIFSTVYLDDRFTVQKTEILSQCLIVSESIL